MGDYDKSGKPQDDSGKQDIYKQQQQQQQGGKEEQGQDLGKEGQDGKFDKQQQ